MLLPPAIALLELLNRIAHNRKAKPGRPVAGRESCGRKTGHWSTISSALKNSTDYCIIGLETLLGFCNREAPFISGEGTPIAETISPVLEHCELFFSQAIIWVKEHPVLTRKDYMGNHEWCFYGWREGAAHRFFGPANVADVWSVKKVNPSGMIHLTEKPVELAVRAMQYSSQPGENVLDLFGGSGSTLIAAEQTGRKAFLMELDPLYCDVIVKRWERFTGQTARRDVTDACTVPAVSLT